MSDEANDTPDAATKPLNTATADGAPKPHMSKGLLLGLGITIGALAAAVIALVVVLMQGPAVQPDPFPAPAAGSTNAPDEADESDAPTQDPQGTGEQTPPPTTPPANPQPPVTQPNPAPAIVEFRLWSPPPHEQCAHPTTTHADLDLSWESSVGNERAELRRSSAQGEVIHGNLPSNHSMWVQVPCDAPAEHFTVALVVKGDSGDDRQASQLLRLTPPAALIDSFTVELTRRPDVRLKSQCIEATRPGNDGFVILRLTYSVQNTNERVYIDRVTQPGGLKLEGNVTYDPKNGVIDTAFVCDWVSAEYILRVTGTDGVEASRSVEIAQY